MSNFKDKVAIVTGGTSGIGKATALALGALGAKVVVVGRREPEGKAVVAAIDKQGGEASFFRADIAKEADIAAMIDFTVKTYGQLDMAFNNAGIESVGATTEVTEAEYRKVFDLNVWGVMASMKHEIAAMLKTGGGSIVNTSSVAGHFAMPQIALYAASKHAVEGLTKAVALEYARQGIRVNAVAPAGVKTEMYDRFVTDDDQASQFALAHPVGRVGQSEEIANAVIYLLDPANGFTTGTSLKVDGGWTAQ